MGVRVERQGLTGRERKREVKVGAQVSFLEAGWIIVSLFTTGNIALRFAFTIIDLHHF